MASWIKGRLEKVREQGEALNRAMLSTAAAISEIAKEELGIQPGRTPKTADGFMADLEAQAHSVEGVGATVRGIEAVLDGWNKNLTSSSDANGAEGLSYKHLFLKSHSLEIFFSNAIRSEDFMAAFDDSRAGTAPASRLSQSVACLFDHTLSCNRPMRDHLLQIIGMDCGDSALMADYISMIVSALKQDWRSDVNQTVALHLAKFVTSAQTVMSESTFSIDGYRAAQRLVELRRKLVANLSETIERSASRSEVSRGQLDKIVEHARQLSDRMESETSFKVELRGAAVIESESKTTEVRERIDSHKAKIDALNQEGLDLEKRREEISKTYSKLQRELDRNLTARDDATEKLGGVDESTSSSVQPLKQKVADLRMIEASLSRGIMANGSIWKLMNTALERTTESAGENAIAHRNHRDVLAKDIASACTGRVRMYEEAIRAGGTSDQTSTQLAEELVNFRQTYIKYLKV